MQQVVLEEKLDPEVCKALAEHLDEGVQPYGTVPDVVTCEICGAVAEVIVEGGNLMLTDAIGVLCGLLVLATIVAVAPFVFRMLGSSWPEPKPERKPTQQPKREPPIRVYATIEEYIREKLGSEAFDNIIRDSTLTACTASATTSEPPTIESLTALMDKFKPDPFARSPVYEMGDTVFRVNMDMLREWNRSIYEMRPMFLYGNI